MPIEILSATSINFPRNTVDFLLILTWFNLHSSFADCEASDQIWYIYEQMQMDRDVAWPHTAGITRSHTESFLVYRNRHIYEDEWKKVSFKSFLMLTFLSTNHKLFIGLAMLSEAGMLPSLEVQIILLGLVGFLRFLIVFQTTTYGILSEIIL